MNVFAGIIIIVLSLIIVALVTLIFYILNGIAGIFNR